MKIAANLLLGACSAALFHGNLQAQNTVGGTSTGSGAGSGDRNLIWNSFYARIGGGFTNVIVNGANFSVVGGGWSNAIAGGGIMNMIGGGAQNLIESSAASQDYNSVGGGQSNRITGSTKSTIGGGWQNLVSSSASHATVGGGYANLATATGTTVGGGTINKATQNYGTVPGGYGNEANGQDSFAAGVRAKANHEGAFVWNSVFNSEASSTNAYSFTARAPGGVRFISASSGATTGVILVANGTSWASLSDSNAKTDIEPVNAREVLKKVAALPVTSWHYKHDLGRRYIGPMAQDFHAAFGLGSDDKTITTLDTDGVTLAAIKGLVEELEARDFRIGRLEDENAQMRAQNKAMQERLQAIDERLSKLPPAP